MNNLKKGYWIILRFLLYFAINAFVISCSFILFFHDIELTAEQISHSAKITFFNVFVLTTFLVCIDSIRRKWTVDRPIKRINNGLNQIMNGNFNTQIIELNSLENTNDFNTIIRQINKMAIELKSVETLRNDFISNVSHELKTPLAIIQNYGVMLQSEHLSNQERKEYAKSITKTSKRLADLITNILKLNKLENQKIYPEPKKYNLTEQLCECILNFESEWEKKSLLIETDMEEDVLVYADGELLSLVWNNLISNAIKFTDDGIIFVGLATEGNDVFVTVQDTGCGMTNTTGKHIFDKFYQGDTSHATQGNGLGLALVKKVIDIMNGEIIVQSEVGKGSKFIIKLQVAVHEQN